MSMVNLINGFPGRVSLIDTLPIGILKVDRTWDGVRLGLGGNKNALRKEKRGSFEVTTRDQNHFAVYPVFSREKKFLPICLLSITPWKSSPPGP